MKQGSKVETKATGRTGVVESGIPFRVGNRQYITVRWNDDNTTSNVGIWTVKPKA